MVISAFTTNIKYNGQPLIGGRREGRKGICMGHGDTKIRMLKAGTAKITAMKAGELEMATASDTAKEIASPSKAKNLPDAGYEKAFYYLMREENFLGKAGLRTGDRSQPGAAGSEAADPGGMDTDIK